MCWKRPRDTGAAPPAPSLFPLCRRQYVIRALTGFSTRHPWKVIALWSVVGMLLAVVAGALGPRATQARSADFLPRGYDSAAALRIAEESFGVTSDAGTVTVLVARPDGEPLTGPDLKRVDAVAREIGSRRVTMPDPADTATKEDDQIPFLLVDHSQTPRVGAAMAAPDGTFELIPVRLVGNTNDTGMHSLYRTFRAQTEAAFAAEGLRTGFTGGLADTVDTLDAEETTRIVTGLLMMGLIVLVHVLVFRSVLAAFVPLLAVVVVSGAATGAVVAGSLLTGISLDASTPGLIGVVLIGIGVDYFLFLLFRFRELLRERPDAPARAVAAEAGARVGTAVTSAALTIVAAFATLGTATFGQFRVLGPSVAVSVLVMLLAALTLMPALLAVTGRRMFRPSRALKHPPRTGLADRTADRVARRPLTALLAGTALLGALAAGLVGIRMDFGQGGTPSGTRAAATAAEIARALPAGVSDPASVYVTAPDGRRITAGDLGGLPAALARIPGVGEVGAPVPAPRGDAVRIDLYPTADSRTREARDLVSGPVRAAVRAHTPQGLEAHVGGTAAVLADMSTAVDKDLRTVFPVAAGLISLILLVLLRSLLAPVVLMLSVGLCFAATLGAATLVFQHGLGEPGVDFTLPLVLFLFVVAIGTDYNILIGDRVREEMERPGPARAAVARAVRHTAPAIATAGVVLAASFGSLATGSNPSTRQIGFATGLGILLSAFVLSIVLVPAAAALLGRHLWWPVRPGRRRTEPPAPGPAPTPPHRPERLPTGL
ncbi:membrane protein [Streptomyces termitum]|uniref:Membrane protein n=1 Tax=Streptomyces termitum TaxID=67368 RepID=A0A918T8Y0_9ACTN|nr:membrane protein [Streptomyces termitum]